MTSVLETSPQLDKLVLLLSNAPRGAFVVALCDSVAHARDLIAAIRERLAGNVVEVTLDGGGGSPLDVLRFLQPGDVVCLLGLERASADVFRSLDLQREMLAEYDVSVVCWATRAAQRELANEAPNLYAFRSAFIDLSVSQESDPGTYLHWLRAASAFFDIRGLAGDSRRSMRFPLDEWYIPLNGFVDADVMAHSRKGNTRESFTPENGEDHLAERCQCLPLHRLLEYRRLVVVGDPGSGKTTFLRYLALTLCQTGLGQKPAASEERLGLSHDIFPLFIRLSDLVLDFPDSPVVSGSPVRENDEYWLPDCLAHLSLRNGWELDRDFFLTQLQQGSCMVLLDGLDELPDRRTRLEIARRIAFAAAIYDRCRFVVTSRPTAVADPLREFTHARVEPLSDAAVEEYLTRWCKAVYAESPTAVAEHTSELLAAITARPEIRRMARNPVMLTALAVVYWNEKRLPEQRADLYETILSWLSRSREQRPGRAAPERCLEMLQELALAMHQQREGRQIQVRRRWAAEQIAGDFRELGEAKQRIVTAEQFLAEEELDSGIIVSRGEDVRFWHLTFQEYLVARSLASRPDAELRTQLLATERLYRPEWREVFLLLTGVLYHRGVKRVDQLVSAVLDTLPANAPLASLARCAGLLGAAVRDLTPLGYRPNDPRYQRALDQVLQVFDPDCFEDVPIPDAISAAEALGQADDPRFADAATGPWVTIPQSEFWMGAQKTDPAGRNYDPDASDHEAPVHLVQLSHYQIARYPVTVDQYRLFVENGGYRNRACWSDGGFELFEKPDDWEAQLEHPTRPVTWVCWYEAQAYCRWAGCWLPSEAQWERAAGGGDGRRYPWGNAAPNATLMNYGSLAGHPTPVGVFARGASPEGLADMAGNVWEWCKDEFGRYCADKAADPTGSETERQRVVRGGDWQTHGELCRVSSRVSVRPTYRDTNIGFRVVRDEPSSRPTH